MDYLRTHNTRIVPISVLHKPQILPKSYLPKCTTEEDSTQKFDVKFELDRLSNSQDKYRLKTNGKPVPYVTFLENLAKSDDFRETFIQTLDESRFETFRIETPPGTAQVLKKAENFQNDPEKVSDKLKNNAFEFILIDSPNLKDITSDIRSFAEHFERAKGSST